jgi:hypothetical protein
MTELEKSAKDFKDTPLSRILGLDENEDINKFIENMYERLDDDMYGHVTSFNFPIHYLFDHAILNAKLSSSSIGNIKYLRSILKLDMLFELDTDSITSISTDRHATILYKFEYNGRRYIYYSNSGLGINNQICKDDMTSCIIMYFHGKDELWKNFNNYIQQIIEIGNSMNASHLMPRLDGRPSKADEKWDDIKHFVSPHIIDKNEYDIIMHFMKANIKYKGQYLCYALLYNTCNKNNKDESPGSYIANCTINHVLSGQDHILYTNSMKEIIVSKTIKQLIAIDDKDQLELAPEEYKCYFDCHFTTLKYEEIGNIPENTSLSDQNIANFSQFINDINRELNKLDDTTVKYKLKNSFRLFYNNISGLYNNKQHSGSCLFYSYYNLALNIKILKAFERHSNVISVIETFVAFHNKMMYLFCLSNDIQYLSNSNGKFIIENLNNLQHIHTIIKDDEPELLDRLKQIYPYPTFLLDQKKLVIDQLLNFKLEGTFVINNSICREIQHGNILDDFYDYLDDIIYKFRNNSFDGNIVNMVSDIKTIFKEIIYKIGSSDNMLQDIYDAAQRPYDTFDFKDLYFNTMCEIWIIYLIFLYEIYSEDYKDEPKEILTCAHKYHYLGYLIPAKFRNKDDWGHFDYRTYDEMLDKGDTYTKYPITMNSRIINIYLNFNELLNISKRLKEIDFLDRIKTMYHINFEYSNFITIFDSASFFTNYKADTFDYLEMYEILPLYHKIFNENIDNSIRSIYKAKLESFKIVIKNNVNSNNLIYRDYLGFTRELDLSLYILILTDFKLLIVDHTHPFPGYPNFQLLYSLIRNFSGRIFTAKLLPNVDKIFTYLCNTTDNIDDIISTIITIINTINHKKKDWIEKCGFTVPDTDIIDDPIRYEGEKYLSLTYYDGHNSDVCNNNITFLLYRFGLHFKDIDEYILLYPTEGIQQKQITTKDFRKNTIYEIIARKVRCFILIKKYKKCIEIAFKDDPNNAIDIDKCYIFDETNFHNKNKLLFNLCKETHPFISIIPENSPYLCYEKDNHFYLEFVLSTRIATNLIGASNETYRSNFVPIYSNGNEMKFCMYIIKIAPSYIFPTINTYNDDYHNWLLDFFGKKRLTFVSKTDIIKESFSIQCDVKMCIIILDLNTIINALYLDICNTIKCTNPIDMHHFNGILEGIPHNDRMAILQSFYSDHRISEYYCDKSCEKTIANYIPKLIEIRRKLISGIKSEITFNRDDFIVNNMETYLLLMEVNIIINLLNHFNKLNSNGTLKSADIQDKLTILNSIKYFNIKIKDNFYYRIELLFLLQNEYFFKESQMIKYDEIRQELKLDNPSSLPIETLKLHQFMMGKGKTSVFTPLLSFVIKYFKNKEPTIITMEHLIKPTRKYIIFIENLINMKVQIYSDFDAKKRWLENTDSTLLDIIQQKQLRDRQIHPFRPIKKINLTNEINLIDEFDSHHNYLQSMFNSINKNKSISEDLFTYIYNFTFNKVHSISPLEYVPNSTETEMIKNVDLLYKSLNIFYNQTELMTYNKDYGFAYIIYNDIYYIPRICTPFARKDTPVKNSNFSSLLLTLILTFKEYIKKYDCCLNHDILYDYNNILLDKKLLSDIIHISNIPVNKIIEFHGILVQDNLNLQIVNNILTDIYNPEINPAITPEIKNKILIKYLFTVNYNEITITTEQYNMSFQDIIYNKYDQWQVGYTGTASIGLNTYKSHERNVFRKINYDPDEIIEIKLALKGYGHSSAYDYTVVSINKEDTYQNNIEIIIRLLIDNPRGFVDLAGIFLDIENKEIAKYTKSKLHSKKIVYFENDHEAYEYNDNDIIKYTESDPDNFYYYDQCHTVGSDLKQPFDGHVAIIINRNTRYTDFAQALFRFRKINRGTYLSVIFVSDEKDSPKTNEDISLLLHHNEKSFNDEQIYGLKYQLLKAMIRKQTNNYLETDLLPEFMRDSSFTKETIKKYMDNNIVDIQKYINEDDFIKKLYKEIIDLDETKLIKLIVGSGNEIQKQHEEVKEEEHQHEEEEEEEEQLKIKYDKINLLSKFKFQKTTFIEHLNCPFCDKHCCVRLFKSSEIQINNKDIYISFNILTESIPNDEPELLLSDNPASQLYKDMSRFIFIEFNDKILIEDESAGLDYYINKLPIYNFEGKLLVSYMYNGLNKQNYLQILDIDYRFIRMLGIKNYTNPICDKQIKKMDNNLIVSAVNNLTNYGFIILTYHLLVCPNKNRYNISEALKNRINNFEIEQRLDSTDFKIPLTYTTTHNFTSKDNLTNVYFNMYNSKLQLDANGYVNNPDRITYKSIFYRHKYDTHRNKDLLRMWKYKLKEANDATTYDNIFQWPKGYIFKDVRNMTKEEIIYELKILNVPYDVASVAYFLNVDLRPVTPSSEKKVNIDPRIKAMTTQQIIDILHRLEEPYEGKSRKELEKYLQTLQIELPSLLNLGSLPVGHAITSISTGKVSKQSTSSKKQSISKNSKQSVTEPNKQTSSSMCSSTTGKGCEACKSKSYKKGTDYYACTQCRDYQRCSPKLPTGYNDDDSLSVYKWQQYLQEFRNSLPDHSNPDRLLQKQRQLKIESEEKLDSIELQFPVGHIFRHSDQMLKQEIIDELKIRNQPCNEMLEHHELAEQLSKIRNALPDHLNPDLLKVHLPIQGYQVQNSTKPKKVIIDPRIKALTTQQIIDILYSLEEPYEGKSREELENQLQTLHNDFTLDLPSLQNEDTLSAVEHNEPISIDIPELTRLEGSPIPEDLSLPNLTKDLKIPQGGSFNNKIGLTPNEIISRKIYYKKYLKYKKKYLDLKYSL